MEGNKESGSGSGSSFVNDLFGPKENPDQALIDTIYKERNWLSLPEPEKNGSGSQANGSGSQARKAGNAVADQNGVGVQGQDNGSTYYQEVTVHQPFHYQYSSSIYYGGPDLYVPPQTDPSPYFTTFTYGTEEAAGYATRGNWWMGSLYY